MPDLDLDAIEKRCEALAERFCRSNLDDFETHARTDVPALVARVRELEKEASEFEVEIQEVMSARVDSMGTEKDKRIAVLEAALAQVKLDEMQPTAEWLAENTETATIEELQQRDGKE